MELTKEQHANNVKSLMLNKTDAVYNAILRGDDPRDCKEFQLYLKKTNDYLNKHQLIKTD